MRPRTHTPGRAIAAPTTDVMDSDQVLDLTSLAEAYATRVAQMETYIEEHDFLNDWNTTVRRLVAETGVRLDHSRDDSPIFTTYHDYDITLAPEGVVFTGFHPHENDHTITIPYAFFAPETRYSVIEPLREKWSELAESQRAAQAITDRQSAQEALDKAQREVDRARARVEAFNN